MGVDEHTQQRVSAPGRLRFVLDDATVDVAAPADAPLTEVLTAVLSQLSETPSAPDVTDWVVQRLGEDPLDQTRTSTQLNLLDGESLYIRRQADALEPFSSDAQSEGTGSNHSSRPWSATSTRWALRVLAAVALAAAFGVATAGVRPAGMQAVLTAVTTVLLLVASSVVGWSANDRRAATLLGLLATCYAAAAGWFSVLAAETAESGNVHWAAAAAAASIAACAGLIGAAHAAPLFSGVLAMIVLLLVPVVLVAFDMATPPHAAAIGLTVSLVTVLFVPGIAFRLSGMALPMLPTNAEELREEIDPVSHGWVVTRGANSIRFLKGLHVGIGLAQCVLLLVLATEDGSAALWFTIFVTLLMFLRARHLSGVVQRWGVLVPAGLAAASVAMRMMAGEDFAGRLVWVGVPSVAIGVLLLLLSGRLPGKRLKPYWLRAVDILESLAALALVPLLLGVLDVYHFMRQLGS